MTEFGSRLSEAMRLAGMTKQTELAKEIGATKATVGQAINGQTVRFSAALALKASLACDVDPYWLVLGSGEAREPLRDQRRRLSPRAVYIGGLLDALPDDGARERAYALIIQLLEFGGGRPD